MVLITFLKPNIVVQSDRLISGDITVFDKDKHLLYTRKVTDHAFVTIRVLPEWPKEIGVSLRTGSTVINKELKI